MKKTITFSRLLPIMLMALLLTRGASAWGQSTYNLVTSTSDLVAGAKYLIVSTQTAGSGYVLGLQNTSNRAQVAITVLTGSPVSISTTPASATTDTKPFEITLGGSVGAWTLYDAVNTNYLRATSSSNNYLQLGSTSNWTISFSSNAAVLTSLNNSVTRNILRYNSANSLFSCYSSGQNAVYLYKLVPAITSTIMLSTASLSGFAYTQGSGPSGEQSFTVGGSNLTSDISIAASTNYEVSTISGSGYTTPLTLTQTSGSVGTTTIYARLKAGLAAGSYNAENISVSSTGAITQNVSCSGSVTGLTTPSLTAAVGATVDAPFDITFTDDAAWRGAITGITVGGTTLDPSAYNKTMASKITFTPSASSLLQSPSSKSITISASGYSDVIVIQAIAVGVAAKLAMKTQPGAPSANGGALATQPSVYIQDQYGNATTSTATVAAAVGTGTWTLGGTTSITASAGTATYGGLTATSAATVIGATISFTSDGLTGVSSNSFNIPSPPQSLPIVENFDYTASTDLTANGWNITGTNASPTIAVSASSITYPGYLSSGVGNEVAFATSGQDVNKIFVAQTTGTFYASMLVNVASAQSGDYFFSLGGSPFGTGYRGRIFIKSSGGGFVFGVAHSGSAGVYGSTVYSFGITYLVVLKYTIVSGTGNDLAAIYINPALHAVEPSSNWLANTDTPTDPTEIGSFALRQGASGSAAALKVDGIRISTSWTDIVGALPTFTGTGDWTDTSRWNTGVIPDATANVVVDGDATISTNAQMVGLTLNASKSLTVNAGKQLTVSTALTNNGTLNLLSDVTNGTATLLTSGTVSGSGTTNVNQALTYRTWYMSSPVASASPAGMTAIRSYDEATNAWSAAALPMVVGKGYSVTPPNDGTNNILFTGGLPNTGENTIVLTKNGITSQAGFNAVGNPYPSYIDWKAVVTKNAAILETGTMWYRSKVGGNFKFYTVDALGNVAPLGFTATAFIPPMQAFWVKTINGGGTFYFEDNQRSHAGTVQNPSPNPLNAPATQNSELPLLRLQVSNGTNSDEAVIYSYSSATNGYDFYDSPKMLNNDATIPEIYTTLNNQPIVINAMNSLPLNTEIGLRFVPGNASSFSIRANEISNLPSDVKVILKDNANNGTETDLTDGVTTYEFSSATITGNRFSLIFRSAGLVSSIENPDNIKMLVYSNAKNQLTVIYNAAINDASTISVYNAVGQKLMNRRMTGTSTVLNGTFTPGVYVVKVNNVIRKIIVE